MNICDIQVIKGNYKSGKLHLMLTSEETFWEKMLHCFLLNIWRNNHLEENSHQLMAGPLSRRLCPLISRNNERKMTPTITMSIFFRMAAAAILFLMDSF